MIIMGSGRNVEIALAFDSSGRGVVRLALSAAGGEQINPLVILDENHAAALVLALQAAIAEVQARAVSL